MKLLEPVAIVSVAFLLSATASESAVIDSVQTGTTTLGPGVSQVSVTVTAVTMARSVLFFGVQEDNVDPANGHVRGRLTSTTNIAFDRADTATTVLVRWYVAEFASGVSVQRGSQTMTTDTVNVTLTSVDLSKTFALISYQHTGTTYGVADFYRARLTSSANLELSKQAGGSTGAVVDWQVVELTAGGTVQKGDLSFLSSDTSKTAVINAVDSTKAFLLAYWNVGGTGIAPNFIRGRIASATQLTFDRADTGTAVSLTYFVVGLNDASAVQNGNASFSSSETTKGVTLTAVSLSRSVAFLSGRGYGGITSANADNPGPGWFTTDLTTTVNLQFARGTTGTATAEAAWFVVEFNNKSVAVSNSVFAFGTRPLNTWLDADSSVLTNDSPVAENLVGKISSFTYGADTWALSSSANGPGQIRAQWSDSGATGPWNDIAAYDSPFTITTGLTPSSSITLYLRIQTPTSTGSFNQHSSVLTVTAQ
jgi:hypothetical protein